MEAYLNKGSCMPMNENTQDNNINNQDKKANVIVREMPVSTWHKCKIQCATKQMTLAQYLTDLIEKDVSN